MAITSEIIGKLGGADVESMPVSGTASGGTDSVEVIATIEVPAGETWLIAAIGEINANSTVARSVPELILGSIRTRRTPDFDQMTIAGVHTGVVELSILRRNSSGSDSFTGTVYTVKL